MDQWKREVEDYYLDFYVRNPEYLAMLPEEEQLAITNSLTGMRQYCEMPPENFEGREAGRGEAAMDEDPAACSTVSSIELSLSHLSRILDACPG